ncbi:MAG: Spx/MgsR family RNA polymerase-binding regulatory protein [Chitinophagaceae bacterium]|jgi:Spx/MgsR family transcriptional regulator|nr:Spx/MgsR family RNA polymerase-binding regulatory protein [Chitinophagaceae bacterium]
MYTVYGIPNCNTVKKSLDWLDQHSIEYRFHNYKKDKISLTQLNNWCKQIHWQELINKKGTTWKKLDASLQLSVTNQKAATHLMAEYTSVIKRPVIELDEKIVAVGFDENEYEKVFVKK